MARGSVVEDASLEAVVEPRRERSQRRLRIAGVLGMAVLGALALAAVASAGDSRASTLLNFQSLQDEAPADAAPAGDADAAPADAATTQLQEEPAAAAAPVITFPEDYPNSVRHFLLIGFLGNIISAGVFFFLSTAKEHRSVIGSFTWMTCAIAALAYYAMYAGVGVQYKTTDVTPRVIFWARYVDRFVTTPLLLCALSAFAKAEFPVLVSLLGADIIMMSCLALGAFVAGPDKYFWWVGALVLFVVMVSQLLTMLAKVEDEKRKEVLRTLTWLTIICWVGYIVLWLLGSEGTAALGLSQEVGLTCILDLVAKAGVLFYLVSNQDASDEAKGTGLTLA